MRRFLICGILAALLCALTACAGARTLSGQVTGRETGADGSVVLTIVQDGGDRAGLRVGPDTWVSSWLDGASVEDLLTGDFTGFLVFAEQGGRAADGPGGLPVYETPQVIIEGVLAPSARTLADGTALTERRMMFPFGVYYQLPDGTELLNDRTYYPLGEMIGDQAEQDGLSPEAAQNIRDFYDRRGPLYHTDALLEAAYAELQARDGEPFDNGHLVEQSTYFSASNDRLWYAGTVVYLPLKDGYGTELRLGEVFDRATGEPVDLWDLFACPPEEAPERLIAALGVDDPVLEAELRAALKPEYVIFGDASLEVNFPQGTLPSQEYSWGTGVHYAQLEGLLHSWAVPDPPVERPA